MKTLHPVSKLASFTLPQINLEKYQLASIGHKAENIYSSTVIDDTIN